MERYYLDLLEKANLIIINKNKIFLTNTFINKIKFHKSKDDIISDTIITTFHGNQIIDISSLENIITIVDTLLAEYEIEEEIDYKSILA